MSNKKQKEVAFKYEFTQNEASFLIQAVNKAPVSGVPAASMVVHLVNKLQGPIKLHLQQEAKQANKKEPKKGSKK